MAYFTSNGRISGVTIGTGLTLSGNTLTSASISDGDKGDIDVTSSGATWTVDTNAVTTVKINNSAVTSDKLASGAASGAKLGTITYLIPDTVDVNLSSFLSTDWLSTYSQLYIWIRIDASQSKTITFPTPSSTYAGKVVEIVATPQASSAALTIASSTAAIWASGNTAGVDTFSAAGLGYVKMFCAQEPRSGDYKWIVMDYSVVTW